MTPDPQVLDRARRLLTDADRIFVLTGAGVSAESGVPTFRGEAGLWKRHRPEELATPQAFARDPRLVWEWYGWRRELVSRCLPNPAHRALATLAARSGNVSLVTQNVDDLHERAASELGRGAPAPSPPLHLHGSLFSVRCTRCSWRGPHRASIDATSLDTLPRCDQCGSLLRPDVVWFGEALDREVLQNAFERAREANLCLVVGTSAVVHPAASLPLVTRQAGGALVEVNPDDTGVSHVADAALRGPAGALLPLLIETL